MVILGQNKYPWSKVQVQTVAWRSCSNRWHYK